MIKVLTERPLPPGYNAADEAQVRRHARISVDAIGRLAARVHWICSYVTADKMFGVLIFESEADLRAYEKAAADQNQSLKVHRVMRVIDAASAE